MKKVILLPALAAISFSLNTFAADVNKAQLRSTSINEIATHSFIGPKPRPTEWLTGDEHTSVAGPKPRPPKWLLRDDNLSIAGVKPRPPKW